MGNSLHRRGSFSVFTLIIAPFLLLTGRQLAADMDDDIGEATDAGINFLIKAIEAKQFEGVEDGARKKEGKVALETYALIVAGLGVDHPTVQKNLEFLGKMSLAHTYSVACYIFALDAAINQIQSDAALANPNQRFKDDPSLGAQYRARLAEAVTALIRLRQGKAFEGGWNYTAGGNRFDNSNTQFAVLGLGVGAKRKVPIPKEVWEEIANHFIKGQKKDGPEVKERLEFYPEEEKGEGKRDRVNIVDKKSGEKVEKGKKTKEEKEKEKKGATTVVVKPVKPNGDFGAEALQYFSRGWDYENKGGETWNMTCSGLSSLILTEENLRGQITPEFQNQLNKSIRDGYGWLMTHWNPVQGGEWSYYGMYSLEKVGDLGEVKKFAEHEWYQELARHLLEGQHKDGSWGTGGGMEVRWNTAFSLLILNRATSLLTQGRSTSGKKQFTSVGGPRKDKDTSDERNWVYIPEFEREFHIPTILRQSRLRPSAKLRDMLELAFKNYPEVNIGFLVMPILNNWELQRNKGLKQFLDDWLAKITGVKYEEHEKYKAWSARYMKADKIGIDKKDPEEFLKACYSHTTKSVSLKKKLLWAVRRCNREKNIQEGMPPLLLEDLNNPEQDVRQDVYEVLAALALSKEPIPAFDAKGAQGTRDGQVVEIKTWYTNRKPPAAPTPAPPPGGAPAAPAAPTPPPGGAPGATAAPTPPAPPPP